MTLLLRPRTAAAAPPPSDPPSPQTAFAARVFPYDPLTVRGTPVTLAVEFVDLATGGLADPASVTLQQPAGVSLTYPGELVRDGPGRYHADIGAPDAGSHAYRWAGTGVIDLPFLELLVLPRSA